MCGVTAAYAHAGDAPALDRDELRRVRDHMAARGPDGAGEWFSADGRVGLGHRRLAIIDLSERGAQPMASADGSLVISFNGEIYNWRELRDELLAAGCAFRSDSDTEVLLQLYRRHGVGMLPMLRGMFAFALWDGTKRELLLARDPFGIKPLYVADDGRTCRAASQVKALLRADVDSTPEPAGHAGFLLWGSVPDPWTLYRGIRSVPAGHWQRVTEDGIEAPHPYFNAREVMTQACREPARGSAEDAMHAIAEAIRDSVRAHLVSDVPVGLFLSAGLDSAMIASGMAATGARPNSITLGFDEFAGAPDDERAPAAQLAQLLGLPHSVPTIDRRNFEADLERLLACMDQPSIDGVNTWFVARAAARAGMKVALSGLGGDELLASYPSFRQVPALRNAMRVPARIPGAGYVFRQLARPLVRHWGSPKSAGLLELGGTTGGAYLLRRGLFMPWELPALMGDDMARCGLESLQTLARLDDASRLPAHAAADRLQVTALETAFYMRHQLLRDADWAGMAHSLEIRVPFVDVTLFQGALPWLAAHPSVSKAQVARAVAPSMPPEWFTRPKTGFQIPVRQWLPGSARKERGLRPWAGIVLERARLEPAARGPRPRVLVSTITPGIGGVQSMTGVIVETLARRGLEPVLAHYEPYSLSPMLSVPSYRLGQRRVDWRGGRAYGEHEANAIGAWLPELEFTHYAATPRWRDLIAGCSAYVAVSGNILAATPFWQCGKPFLAWVATDWDGDRENRVKSFPPARKLLDRVVNTPIIRRLESTLLQAGRVLPISQYTQRVLSRIARRPALGPVLPSGVDTAFFVPDAARHLPGHIGFSGRFSDPRKNVELLLRAVAELRRRGHDVRASIIGDVASPSLVELARSLAVESHVAFLPPARGADLLSRLQSLDVFVVPSHQEGLCIAALEAMACAVPVVSTRCGGPEEFVIDGETGFLTDADPGAMADRIATLLADREQRDRIAQGARKLVEDRYSVTRTMQVFWDSFASTFPHVAAAVAPA